MHNELNNGQESEMLSSAQLESEFPLDNDQVVSKIEKLLVNAPSIIKKCVMLVDAPLEKLMTLYSIVVMLGSLLPKVKFVYNDTINYANLYLVIFFPPASGKGKQAILIRLFEKIVKEQLATNVQASKKYRIEESQYKKLVEKGQEAEMPIRPKFSLLHVPGNISSSKFTEQLQENDPDSMTLIFESEVDAFALMMKSTFGGGNSMILRNGFHNEMISQMRKNLGEHLIVHLPKIAMVLTGTISQAFKLFDSLEDGLFTRYMVLTGEAPVVWKDVSPCDDCNPINDKIDVLQDEVYEIYSFFKDLAIEVKFSKPQWERINAFGRPRLENISSDLGENATGISKRHALMIARMAVVFTMLRYFENKSNESIVECLDVDFEIAYYMAEVSYENSIVLYERLSSKFSESFKDPNDDFFELLPDTFKRAEVAPLQAKLNMSEKSINRRLNSLLENKKLLKTHKGFYKKIEVSQMTDDPSSN